MGVDTRIRTDAVLLAEASEGDLGAMRELYDRHAPWLTARLMRRCNDPEVVADVVQDAFVAAWKGAGHWRADGEVAAWLWGIGFRLMVSRLRGRKDVLLTPVWDDSAAGTLAAAEDEVLTGVEYGDLGTALSRLSPEFRAVIQACVLDGLTTKEASRLLGVRQNTVKTRLHRAKAQMRASLVEIRTEAWS
jgi:RNA polymerase sigma factor (sigma-70 family)